MKSFGIIAGSGELPILIAKGAKDKGINNIIVAAITGETNKDIEMYADIVVWLEIGQMTEIINCFKNNGCENITLAGQISQKNNFSKLKLDLRLLEIIPETKFPGHVNLFKGIGSVLQKTGLNLIDCKEFVSDHLALKGLMTERELTTKEAEQLDFIANVKKSLSDTDVGQTIAVKDNCLIAIEGIEGTNQTIKRSYDIAGSNLIIIKFSPTKKSLDTYTPVVGEETIRLMNKIGSHLLVVEANNTIMLNRDKLIKLADKLNISILGS